MMKHIFKTGDKVVFDSIYIEKFIAETSDVSDQISQYQKLVLEGINQVGTVKAFGPAMTTVFYEDGWELPIPTKYLVMFPPTNG
jgi:hypothetical protein